MSAAIPVFRFYFYPRPPRGGRLGIVVNLSVTSLDFYPRPPRGGRPNNTVLMQCFEQFLSTPSARRATRSYSARISGF